MNIKEHIERILNDNDTLYDPQTEHDACGVGFIAHLKGVRSHEVVKNAIQILVNLSHRGAAGCDPCTGDGAGIMLQIPDEFYKSELKKVGVELSDYSKYGTGIVFLPQDLDQADQCRKILEESLSSQNVDVICWRQVPIDTNQLGYLARDLMPNIDQIFVKPRLEQSDLEFNRLLFIARKQAAKRCRSIVKNRFYVCSLSCTTIVYKGLLLPEQMDNFYLDLKNEQAISAIALVHSRFSTNTLPSWELAHPFRFICHNGEINTLRGNKSWMKAKEAILKSKYFTREQLELIKPVIYEQGSDSSCFDNMMELLIMSGRTLPEAMMIMIPEAWEKHPEMDPNRQAFYRYHASTMEPWDGPADMAFTDGRYVGAMLDRNGLRPARFMVTEDDYVILSSETGVLPIAPEKVLTKGRLQPGRMFIVDTKRGKIIEDSELKAEVSQAKPYQDWLDQNVISLDKLKLETKYQHQENDLMLEELVLQQRIFGYSLEDLNLILAPMAADGKEPVGSMGNDASLAILSKKPRNFYDYFKQLFAQVTNPPIDPIRESTVMSLLSLEGERSEFLEDSPEKCRRLELEQPILTNEELEVLLHSRNPSLKAVRIKALFNPQLETGLADALDQLCEQVGQEILNGAKLIVLSDRGVTKKMAPIPSLLAASTIHHYLIRVGLRMKAGIIVESADVREVSHVALLIGYGVGAINPYLAFASIKYLVNNNYLSGNIDFYKAQKNYIKAIGDGVLKVLSKMGISTLQSYKGSQLFEAIGLSSELISQYFTNTPSRIEGASLGIIQQEVTQRFNQAYSNNWVSNRLDLGGQYHWRVDGENHQWNPESISLFQKAVRGNSYQAWKEFSSYSDNQSTRLATIRGLLKIKSGNQIPISEVEPVAEIVKRFATGAMSFGSISREAHETLAIGMNRLGGKSNTGEGGEDPARFKVMPNGDSRRSAIKQIASGRFGVTAEYLVNADELQIKIAQGAKPGEGGQLPGHKVNEEIAAVRHSTPGVQLISPPPHHDIYSIEDLAQLIFDLKNVNPEARISVKLVAEHGVGTIAAGVSKAHADLVLISGHDGGTGASPISSIKHAGIPWEIGVAETQQVLVQNGLRSRIIVQADGQLKTGRDVAVAALLGAEEFGFATSGLIALGCIMMRKCHLNTCPVGVATQDPKLRQRFNGKPEHITNFLTFVAEELREIMASLGIRKLNEMVGRVDLLDYQEAEDHWKVGGISLAKILSQPKALNPNSSLYCSEKQDHNIANVLDRQLIELCGQAIHQSEKLSMDLPIANFNRTTAAMLSGVIAKENGAKGLPDGSIVINFHGSAGQSFGAFLARGVELRLEGDANDYLGKGLSGGRIIVYPPKKSKFKAEDNILVGNTLLYGATSGEVFLRGQAGERFAVRNSGATAVVEGVGDHGCEYMTAGVVVNLGQVGRNFAAGMSGGLAFVFDPNQQLQSNCNHEMVTIETLDLEDCKLVHSLILRHLDYTGSQLAEQILSKWDELQFAFKKIYPTEYRRVVELKKQELMMEVAHG